MTPDDPRHGTYAGAQRHWKDGESPCQPCLTAARRDKKRRELAVLAGKPARVSLGADAYRIVVTAPRTHLEAATGIRKHRLREFELAGPGKTVHRDTRDRILAAGRPWTAIGVQRRLQALAVAGWSGRVLSERTGVEPTTLCNIRRRELKFVRGPVAAAVIRVFAELAEHPAPAGRSATEARAHAQREGWAPAYAWLDIDDPDETPDPGWSATPRAANDVDPVVVDRVLAGDSTVRATPAEKRAVVQIWRETGRSLTELQRLTGWKPERYYTPGEDAA